MLTCQHVRGGYGHQDDVGGRSHVRSEQHCTHSAVSDQSDDNQCRRDESVHRHHERVVRRTVRLLSRRLVAARIHTPIRFCRIHRCLHLHPALFRLHRSISIPTEDRDFTSRKIKTSPKHDLVLSMPVWFEIIIENDTQQE